MPTSPDCRGKMEQAGFAPT
ncbi:hypothetical protein PIIN_11646 [Serendipita indica DSM 11827]|uniref:Uncharacterized protein n=1 Tax=Serendipita indica (strain DSM 11827) TaxID=1109443 RepID=G4U275_SERID|nr:hypothetical protein PIIN_11646 [Serendipita indica DSM 11827]